MAVWNWVKNVKNWSMARNCHAWLEKSTSGNSGATACASKCLVRARSAKLACLSHLWGQQSWRTLTQKRTVMNRRDRTSVVCFCPNSPTELRQERNRCVRGRVGKGDRNSTVVWFHIFKNDWSLQISVFHFHHSLKALNENNHRSKTKCKVIKVKLRVFSQTKTR